MSKIEVDLPDRIQTEIDRLVEQGEFLDRDHAVEELLSQGVSAYEIEEEEPEELEEDLFTQAVEDQQDPAAYDDSDEENYSF